MTLFPMFLNLESRSCLVVGAEMIAESKIRSLLAAGAKVRVIAPEARKSVEEWARAGVLVWEVSCFEPRDLEDIFLVIAATGSNELNAQLFSLARERGILCNAVDDPEHCDFYFPALVRRGDLQIAISTAGHSPALAQRLRRELQEQFSPEYAGWLDDLGRTREQLFRSDVEPAQRRQLLHGVASHKNFEKWRAQMNTAKESLHET